MLDSVIHSAESELEYGLRLLGHFQMKTWQIGFIVPGAR